MPSSGTISFPPDHAARTAAAITLSGLLAEHSINRITLADPRICATRDLAARETNLPKILIEAHPGTTLSLGEVALMIDEEVIRWTGDGPLATALAASG